MRKTLRPAGAMTSALALVAATLVACGAGDAGPAASSGDDDAGGAATKHPDGGGITPSGDASTTTDATPPPKTVKDGVLVGGPGPLPGALAGVEFHAGDQKGTTDAAGTFHYRDGDSITFTLAGVELATVPAKPMLSPFALAGGPCAISDALKRVLVTLETLDTDGKPETGIAIGALTTPSGESRKLAAMSDTDFATWLSGLAPGHAAVDADAALTRFVLQIDGEEWAKTDETQFDTVTSATRSQGVTWDGTGYVFSWTLGLQRTDASLSTTVNKTAAIPLDMLVAGSNHIGDVDVWQGTLYAPIEDGSKYQHPTIVLYDAQTLDAKGPRFPIDDTLLTKGVPWVAVDGPRNVAYVAEWDPTPAILVFDLATFTHQRSIPLSTTLGRIQGAKVLEGSLYATRDDDQKTVLKIDLDTGIVLPELFHYGSDVVKELEGLAAIPEQGTTAAKLRVLGVDAGKNSVTFRTHTRTRSPLKNAICAP